MVKHTLRVLSQLIDWNELKYFGNLLSFFKEFIKMKKLRSPAFDCLGSIVGKGMSEEEKIQVIIQTGFIEEVSKVEFEKAKDRTEDDDLEEVDEEEKFLSSISEAILRVGKWSLQLYGQHTRILQKEEDQKNYVVILEHLLNKAMYLLDCDKPSIGRPVLEFFAHWVQIHAKQPELTED